MITLIRVNVFSDDFFQYIMKKNHLPKLNIMHHFKSE